MDMILLDWTRMGKTYCLAGAVLEGDHFRIVRPLLWKFRDAPVRNVGWSPYQLDGFRRWEVFELVGPETAAAQPPHTEDTWVRTLRPRRFLAPSDYRQSILHYTRTTPGEPVFGENLEFTRASAFLPPGHGLRSLATLHVPSDRIVFSVSRREGMEESEVRIGLRIPPLDDRLLPMKDHHLLLKIEQGNLTLTEQAQLLTQTVRQMGEQVAVRLGLSRPFQFNPTSTETRCWLMIDGLFSLTDPQP